MPRDRFASPDSVWIEISDGDKIEVKKELNTRDQRKMSTLAIVPTRIDGKLEDIVDWARYELERTALWLIDWTLVKDGKPIPATLASLEALNPNDFDEINNAVYTHMMGWIKSKKATRRVTEATLPSGSSASPTLPS